MKLNNQKTLIVFTDWYEPGYRAGGPIQSVYNLVKLLSKNFDVKVVTRNTDYASKIPYQNIKPNQWTNISENHNVMYLSDENIKMSTIRKICQSAGNDTVLINGIFSFYFSIYPLFLTNYYNFKKVFLSVRGMLHQSALAVKPLKKQLFLSFGRGFGLYKKVTLLSTSLYENKEIEKSIGKVKIAIAPNIPMFPVSNQAVMDKSFRDKNGNLRLLFLGRISPEKNPIAVLKAIKKLDYPIKLTFIGASLNKSYQAEFENTVKELPTTVTFEWVQELQHDQVQQIFNQTDVMILPSHGENFGHAIFESFANATPVIIGNNTPWKGIEDQMAGIEVDSDDSSNILTAINTFNALSNETYKQWQFGALNVAKTYFELNNFEEVYLSIFNC